MMHSKIVKNDNLSKITIDEWIHVAENFGSIHITDKLKQQNPFTGDFIFLDVPGAGYWVPIEHKYKGWPGDGSVVFAPSGDGVVFVQFADVSNPELNEIASAAGAKVVAHEIGK